MNYELKYLLWNQQETIIWRNSDFDFLIYYLKIYFYNNLGLKFKKKKCIIKTSIPLKNINKFKNQKLKTKNLKQSIIFHLFYNCVLTLKRLPEL